MVVALQTSAKWRFLYNVSDTL